MILAKKVLQITYAGLPTLNLAPIWHFSVIRLIEIAHTDTKKHHFQIID